MTQLRFAFVSGALSVLLVAAWLTGTALTGELSAAVWRTAMHGLWIVEAVLLALFCPWVAATAGPARAGAAGLAILANALPCLVIIHVATTLPLDGLVAAMSILAMGTILTIVIALPARQRPELVAFVTPILQIAAIVGIFVTRRYVFDIVGL